MAASTICQASTVMNNHSWMPFIPNGYVNSQKFSTQNTMSAKHMKRSTTLFPMRMNEDSSTSVSSREIENGHNQSVCASDIADSSVSKYRPVNETLTTGDLPSSSHNIKKSTINVLKNITQKNIELPADSSDLGSSNSKQLKENQNRKKLSFGSIPKYLKCFTCERIIAEDHFSEHLLFGTVKCSDCNANFRDCQGFQLWAIEYARGNVLCNHTFSYTGEPVAYLTGKLSTNCVDSLLENTKVTTLLENYIDKLKSLQEILPWKHAIKICKDYLAVKHSQCHSLNGNEPSGANKDTFGIAKRSELNSSFIDSNRNNNDRTNFALPTVESNRNNNDRTNFTLPTVESNMNNRINFTPTVESNSNNDRINVTFPTVEEECLDLISQDYCLGQLEDTTEFVNVPERCFSTVESQSLKIKTKKQKETKKRKTTPESLVSSETSMKKSSGDALEFVPLRSDGFYYVATKAIEVCPNCYEVLCPSQFTVNVSTFLITVVCMGCNLTIYITSPEVHIVTEDNQEPEAHNVFKDNQKSKAYSLFKDKTKKSRGRPKKIDARKEFFKS